MALKLLCQPYIVQAAVLVAVAGNAPPRSLCRIASFLQTDPHLLSWARSRWELYIDGEEESTWEDRYAASRSRSPEWTKFVVEDCWLDDEFTRESEKASDKRKNPHTKKDPELKTIRFLEMSNQEMLELVNEKGAKKFGPTFKISSWSLRDLKPWWIKSAGREVCLCRYHLGWDLMVEALYNARKAIKDAAKVAGQELCKCVNKVSGSAMRRECCCPRHEGKEWRERACINNTCGECSNGKKFPICQAELNLLNGTTISYETWEKENKETGEKADFKSTQVLFEPFYKQMVEYYHSTLLPHDDLAKWQDHDWSMFNSHFPRKTFVDVRDFAEGYSHAVKRQHQSAYYSQPYSNLYPIVLSFDARDLNDAFFKKYARAEDGATEKARILSGFEKLQLRPIITFTIIITSPDTKKDFAFVKHVDETILLPFIREIGVDGPQTFTCHYVRSDGCKGQFKCKDPFWWMSQYKRVHKMHLDWSYFCSCHGKCWCDPEGGTAKNAARRHELKATHDRNTELKTSLALHEFFMQELRVPTKDLFQKAKKGHGIYRRGFHYIPAHGEGSVDHKQDEYTRLTDSSKQHHIRTTCASTEEFGIVEHRVRSCHQCDECWKPEGNLSECEHIEITGPPVIAELPPPVHYEQRVLRSHSQLKAIGKDLCKSAKIGMFVVVEVDDRQLKEDMPWIIIELTQPLTKHLGATVEHTGLTVKDRTWMGKLRKNDEYLEGRVMQRPRPGSNNFELSDWTLYFFPQDVRVVDLKLKPYERQTAARTRTANQAAKTLYQLTKAELTRILETLCKDRMENPIGE